MIRRIPKGHFRGRLNRSSFRVSLFLLKSIVTPSSSVYAIRLGKTMFEYVNYYATHLSTQSNQTILNGLVLIIPRKINEALPGVSFAASTNFGSGRKATSREIEQRNRSVPRGTPVRISIRMMRRSKPAFPGKHRRLLTEEACLARLMHTRGCT